MVKSHTHGMQHYHVTDIQHTHGINDPGHTHSYYVATNSGGAYAAPGDMGFYYENYPGTTEGATTGISIKYLADNEKLKTSGGSITAQGAQRTSTDSNNTNNNENRPKNYTVKIWKRTA